MTKTDAARLVAVLVAAYPNFDKFRDAQAVGAVVDLWAAMFSDQSAELVGLALKQHITTSKWPPSVAELRAIIVDIQRPDLIPPDVAWATVSDLLALSGQQYYGDLYSQLPPLVARAVEVIGYPTLYSLNRDGYIGGKAGLDRVTFLAQYTPMFERARQAAMTPQPVVQGIAAVQAQLPQYGQIIAALESARREKAKLEQSKFQRRLAAFSEDSDGCFSEVI